MANAKDYVASLIDAIHRLHGCEATHLETVPVTETFEGEMVWEGDVEVFDLSGHPKAKRAYAWSHQVSKNDLSTRYVAVLGLPPLTSPEAAVRAAVVAEIRSTRQESNKDPAS